MSFTLCSPTPAWRSPGTASPASPSATRSARSSSCRGRHPDDLAAGAAAPAALGVDRRHRDGLLGPRRAGRRRRHRPGPAGPGLRRALPSRTGATAPGAVTHPAADPHRHAVAGGRRVRLRRAGLLRQRRGDAGRPAGRLVRRLDRAAPRRRPARRAEVTHAHPEGIAGAVAVAVAAALAARARLDGAPARPGAAARRRRRRARPGHRGAPGRTPGRRAARPAAAAGWWRARQRLPGDRPGHRRRSPSGWPPRYLDDYPAAIRGLRRGRRGRGHHGRDRRGGGGRVHRRRHPGRGAGGMAGGPRAAAAWCHLTRV